MPILSLLGVEVIVSAEKFSNEVQKQGQFSGYHVRKVSAYSLGKPFIQPGKGIVDSQFWG